MVMLLGKGIGNGIGINGIGAISMGAVRKCVKGGIGAFRPYIMEYRLFN